MKKKKFKKIQIISLFLIKILLVISLFFMFLNLQQGENDYSYENTISLLSVSTNEDDEVIGERLIPLNLAIKEGSGEIFINSNGIIETDTQLSIRNAKETTCTLLSLNCNNYDFYFSFTEDQLLLEGPSAGAAIGVLVAKTVLGEPISKKIGITGSLSSGGVIGVVGGIDEKIKLTENFGFDIVIIPELSSYNGSIDYDVSVVKSLDLLEALEVFDTKIVLESRELETQNYNLLMKELSDNLCERNDFLLDQLEEIEENSSLDRLYEQGITAKNSSYQAEIRESYYSRASFCFGANNNFKSIEELQKNHTEEELTLLLEELEILVDDKIIDIESSTYLKSIQTLNDFYVWLILVDRVYESKEFINNSLELLNSNETNSSQIEPSTIGYAYAKERLITVDLWEEFIVHQGEKISFSPTTLTQTCSALYNEVLLKGKVLEQYEVSIFDESIKSLEEDITTIGSTPKCIYSSLELSARIDTVISSLGVASENSSNFSEKLFSIAKTRLSMHSEDSFPLIPFIYFDYAEELYAQGDYSSSLLYTNYALSFGNLELYLYKNPTASEILKEGSERFLVHPLFILALLLMLGFLR